MATFRLSRLAEADLMEIGAYTLETWGEDRTIRYIDGLETCCRRADVVGPNSVRPRTNAVGPYNSAADSPSALQEPHPPRAADRSNP